LSQTWNRIVIEHLRRYTRSIPFMRLCVDDDQRLIIRAHIPKNHIKILGLNKWKREDQDYAPQEISTKLACSPPQRIFAMERSEEQKVENARYRVKKLFESITEIKDLRFMNVNESTIKIILDLIGTRLIIRAFIPNCDVEHFNLGKWKDEKHNVTDGFPIMLKCSPPQNIFIHTAGRSEQNKVEIARNRIKKFFEFISDIAQMQFENIDWPTFEIIRELLGSVRIRYIIIKVKSGHEEYVRQSIAEMIPIHGVHSYSLETVIKIMNN
ncbi:hypothetical protein PRIPAC_82227, partial [Pristionchus pacificus]|uniref:Uncharacterized protein n=1 Tax=Pristionchus pacificus TaxID=54126 RepID=A0A2A6BWW7_PRIPA